MFTKQIMEQKISKLAIQTQYRSLLEEGHEEWEAKSIVINSFVNPIVIDSEVLEEHNKVGTPEYYFTIKTVWDLCNI
jgi:hypothetical protein